jgi:hypothetical protein
MQSEWKNIPYDLGFVPDHMGFSQRGSYRFNMGVEEALEERDEAA